MSAGFRFRDRAADRLVPRRAGEQAPLAAVTAILAFLAALALALGLAGGRLVENWGGKLAGTATLQIVAEGAVVEQEARAALETLRATPGVRSVRIVELDEQRALLEPWLGTEADIESLPLPLLIDVGIDPGRLNVGALNLALAKSAPHAVFDDHGSLRSGLVSAAGGVRIFAFGTLGILAVAFAAVYVLAARAAALANAPIIRTLRLVGARDSFVAAIFARRLGWLALAAGAVGTAAGLALLALLPRESTQGFYLVAIGPEGRGWLLPLLVPVAATLLGWAATRATLARLLRRWT